VEKIVYNQDYNVRNEIYVIGLPKDSLEVITIVYNQDNNVSNEIDNDKVKDDDKLKDNEEIIDIDNNQIDKEESTSSSKDIEEERKVIQGMENLNIQDKLKDINEENNDIDNNQIDKEESTSSSIDIEGEEILI